MKNSVITNAQADASLDCLVTGDVIKAPNYDHLCQTYLIGNNTEICINATIYWGKVISKKISSAILVGGLQKYGNPLKKR